jgi:anthranilate synthase component 1
MAGAVDDVEVRMVRGARLRPTPGEFVALAAEHSVVPVWCEVLADLETPLSAFVKLVGTDDGFLLESVEHAERWGRWSFLGWDPVATLIVRGRDVDIRGENLENVPIDGGALRALDAMLAKYRAPAIEGLPPFHGGIVGTLGYDTVREIEHLPDVPPDEEHLPDAILALSASVAAFDHFGQKLYLVENCYIDPGSDASEQRAQYQRAVDRLGAALDRLSVPSSHEPALPPDDLDDRAVVHRRTTAGEYARAVEAAKEHILAGDIFQVVLAQRYDLIDPPDPFALYRVLRLVNPSPYMYFVRGGGVTTVGSSPEALVALRDGRVIGRPIAGTRRRGRDDAHDQRLAAELQEHPKERAEHVMLVDLARNDLGRVVAFGSERIDELMTLERYSHVMHLTSQVSGDLRDGCTPVDVLRATFPAGTVSGAPKVRAMEIIDDFEPAKRGLYAGVVGYFDFSGNLDVAIAIRTMFFSDGRASIHAGAGIVADSDPADEDLECSNKVGALLAAASAARRLFPSDR